jgi:hypothetical protein
MCLRTAVAFMVTVAVDSELTWNTVMLLGQTSDGAIRFRSCNLRSIRGSAISLMVYGVRFWIVRSQLEAGVGKAEPAERIFPLAQPTAREAVNKTDSKGPAKFVLIR